MRLLGLDRANSSLPKIRNEPPPDSGADLLVITCDTDLYARIHEIVSVWKWTIRRQTQPALSPDCDLPTIIILDADLADGNWKDALMSLRASANNQCVILASRVFDPYLWDEVVRCGGFDVIARSGEREHLASHLRFAWFWKTRVSHDRGSDRRHSTFRNR